MNSEIVSEQAVTVDDTDTTRREPWFIVICAIIGTAVGASTMAHYGLGVFLTHIAQDFNWTRGGASNAISMYFIGLGLGVPVAGLLVDYIGPRKTALGSASLLAAFMALLGMTHEQEMVKVLCFFMGLAGSATTLLPYTVVIAARFKMRRGLAIGLAATGPGVGGIILPQIINWASYNHDWRFGVFVLSALIVMLALPAATIGLRLNGATAQRRWMVAHSADIVPLWRARPFWTLLSTIVVANLSVGAVIVHASPILTDHGINPTTIAAIISSLSVANVCGKISSGYLMDRFTAPHVAAAFFCLIPVGALVIVAADSLAVLAIGFFIIGLTLGAEADIVGYIATKYLPSPQHGRAIGLIVAAYSLANALGVAALGHSVDLLGSYTPGLLWVAASGPVAAFLITRLGKAAPHG